MTLTSHGVDLGFFADTFARAPFEVRTPDGLKRVFVNTGLRCFVLVNGSSVSAIGAISREVLSVTVGPSVVAQDTPMGYSRNQRGKVG